MCRVSLVVRHVSCVMFRMSRFVFRVSFVMGHVLCVMGRVSCVVSQVPSSLPVTSPISRRHDFEGAAHDGPDPVRSSLPHVVALVPDDYFSLFLAQYS